VESGVGIAANGFSCAGFDAQAAAKSPAAQMIAAAELTIVLELTLMLGKPLRMSWIGMD
jgi:hypothetical protein